MTLRMYAGRKQWPLRAVRVHLMRSQAEGAGQIDVTISFVGELSEEQRRRLLETAEHCPVHRMLASGVGIRPSLEAAILHGRKE
jgi:putative redox protein